MNFLPLYSKLVSLHCFLGTDKDLSNGNLQLGDYMVGVLRQHIRRSLEKALAYDGKR
jgi:hypothetical protein